MKSIAISESRRAIRLLRIGRVCWAFTALLGLFACLGDPRQAVAQSLSKGKGDLRVMTYNVDEGTDYLELQQATDLNQFLVAVGQTITQVRQTNSPQRMQAIAKQIIAAGPALVSLQELDEWYTAPFNPFTRACGDPALEFNFLQELQHALTDQGAHYTLAVEAQQYAFPSIPGFIPPGTFLCVSVVDHVAILARTDLDPGKFHWSNPQSAQYATVLQFPSPLGLLPLPRAWVSVDAAFNGKSFRFIGTHLESVVPAIREAQGTELRAGAANTSLPVILAMDSNAPAAPLPQDPTYLDFIAAGYDDAWTKIFPLVPGFTCCQAQFVNNLVSQLDQRIDLILTLGNIETQNVALFGVDPSTKTPGGLWPSDHAGVAAQLVVEQE
jgi:endonuclease/exonuclease/phosphatase family metal-dependent hydrolase